MDPIYAPFVVAGLGVIIQMVTGYGTYKYFTGHTEERFNAISRDQSRLEREKNEQREQIREQGESIAYMRGQISQKRKGENG